MSSESMPVRLQRDLGGDIALGPHVRIGRAQREVPCREPRTELALEQLHPVHFAGRVEVMAAGIEAGFHHRVAQLHEGPDDVEDDFPALEQFRQRLTVVLHRDAAVVVALELGHLGQLGLQALRVAAGGDEGNSALGELPRRQLAGVAAGAVEHHFVVACHDCVSMLAPRRLRRRPPRGCRRLGAARRRRLQGCGRMGRSADQRRSGSIR